MLDRLPESIRTKIEVSSSGCWLWTKFTHKGYGRVSFAGIKTQRAHRVVWELLRGTPPSKTLDHTCKVKRCVNPEHLEDVIHRTNVLRGPGPTALNAKKTECGVCGGPFAITKAGRRVCRPCAVRRAREHDRRKAQQ